MEEARELVVPYALDVRRTLSVQGRGRADPTYRLDEAGAIWRTSLTPDGPATLRVTASPVPPPVPGRVIAAAATVPHVVTASGGPLAAGVDGLATVGVAGTLTTDVAGTLTTSVTRPTTTGVAGPFATGVPVPATTGVTGPTTTGVSGAAASTTVQGAATGSAMPAVAVGTRVVARAWGPGATWLLDALPACLGLDDDVSGFDPGDHPLIRDAARRNPGLRIGRSGRLMEALVPAILEQKVVILEAHRAWRILLWKYGTPPPGPAPRGMRVFPAPAVWRRIPSWDWHRAGVEGVRAQTIIRAATVADSLERLLGLTHEEADRKLRTISGIGVWTSAEARQRAAGDPDAVSVGDAHLSNIVGYALAGRDRTDDAGMLELLRPWSGHRYRVTRLIGLSSARTPGEIPRRNAGAPPRRGPRMPVRDYRSF